MRELPHAPGYTLNADALIDPAAMIGFLIANHPLYTFEHFHDFFELALVTQGTGLHVTDAGDEPVARGTAVFVAPGVSHGYKMCDDMIVYNCFLRVETAQFDLPWASRDGRLGRLFSPVGLVPRLPVVVTLDEAALVECIDHLDAIRQCLPAERSEAHDLGHLLLVLDVLASRLEVDQAHLAAVDPRAPQLVATAIDVLSRDLSRHWTLDELAAQLCIGPFYLVRLFKRWAGMPPIAYANRRRAERAAVLLSTTDDPVAAIGAQVGWADPSHFSRRFRREFGVGPRDYRNRSHEHQAYSHRGLRPTVAAPRVDAEVWTPPPV
jgi:AraC family L-rhamnose operon transcriptional activator RhaR